ncbi:hypothetical protein TrispH2_011601 [Trichoplax sp. H2]|nr:hypothetical protein TrispH2_011601 [Trichoplax sp. H2]|eukprot:RDD36382.1 hypothetical protein TrispH2_011601 [Trichoplax sp. H2]
MPFFNHRYIDSNRIEHISLGVFHNFRTLYFLDIAENPLKEFVPSKKFPEKPPLPYLTSMQWSGTSLNADNFKYARSRLLVDMFVCCSSNLVNKFYFSKAEFLGFY